MTRLCVLVGVLFVAGCAMEPSDFNRAPAMSAVGSGLAHHQVTPPLAALPPFSPRDPNSLWSPTARSLFSDQRAGRVGDTVTIEINLDDEAEFANRSDRSRDSTIGFDLGIDVPSLGFSTGPVGGDVASGSASGGRGSTGRSEELKTSITAVVVSVLPNGNLVISGSQEVRVNYELRIVSIAGIVRPFDISADNTLPYEKVAEARLTYGGSGRLSEIQQPPWGQQLYDIVTPF